MSRLSLLSKSCVCRASLNRHLAFADFPPHLEFCVLDLDLDPDRVHRKNSQHVR